MGLRLAPPVGFEDWEPEARIYWCLNHDGHEPYTHYHADEPPVTYCLICRAPMGRVVRESVHGS